MLVIIICLNSTYLRQITIDWLTDGLFCKLVTREFVWMLSE